MSEHTVAGPYFDDLSVGHVVDPAPPVTLTDGLAQAHRMILGERSPITLDHELSRRVLGAPTAAAHPCLVCNVAIGQSTVVTQRVVANLFYRGLALHRAPILGDTLHTRTEVVGLRQNRSKPSGLAALRITTTDQHNRTVLDFWRCAMLPMRDPERNTGHDDDLDSIGAPPSRTTMRQLAASFDLDAYRAAVPCRDIDPASATGATWHIAGGDVVTSAPELARLTVNLATVHHDEFSHSGGRLVYGGHTIGIAAAQLQRALPNVVTIAAWHGCDHTGPVREGDTLYSTIIAEAIEPLPHGGALTDLRVLVHARSTGDPDTRQVLDWRPVVVVA